MNRSPVNPILRHLALGANKHREDEGDVHPHALRHTIGSLYREKSGSDTETAAALGHAGTNPPEPKKGRIRCARRQERNR